MKTALGAACAALFLLAGQASASDYVYRDGYWWCGNAAYSKWIVPAYTDCYGRYYGERYYYTYSHTAYAPKLTPADPNWRSRFLDLQEKRDEAKAFQDALNAFNGGNGGVPASPALSGVGVPGYGYAANSLQLGSYGANGSSLYGYSTKALSDLYGDNSLPLALQAYSRAVDNLQKSQDPAIAGLGDAVRVLASGQRSAADTLSRGIAGALVLAASQGQGATQAQSTSVPSYPGNPTPQAPPGAAQMPTADLPPAIWQAKAAIFNLNCVACHGGKKLEGKLDLRNVQTLTGDQWDAIVDRVTTEDLSRRMPRNPDGTPGQRLTPRDLRTILAR